MAVHFISTEGWTHEQWLAYRKDGIGASEFGSLIGQNRYECALRLFYKKLGLKKEIEPNFAMINGHEQEPIITKYWEHFEKDHDTMVSNLNRNKKVRTAESVNGYMYNDKYPNLFVSLDRRFTDPRFPNQYCNLELKNPSYASYNLWDNKNNPMELCQVACQLLVSEMPYAELCHKVGDAKIEITPMYYKDALKFEKMVIKELKLFWDRITKARELLTQIYQAKSEYNMKLALDLQQEFYRIEPPPEKTPAYLEFMTELQRAKKESVAIKGDEDALQKAKQLKKTIEKRKKLELEEVELKSYFANILHKSDKTEISFGSQGSIAMYNGRFTNKVK